MPNRIIPIVIILVILGAVGAFFLLGSPQQPSIQVPQPAPEAPPREEPAPAQPELPREQPPPPPAAPPPAAPPPAPPPREEPPPPAAPPAPPPPVVPPPVPEPPRILEGRVEIIIDGFAFTPGNITIRRGTEIVWIMQDRGVGQGGDVDYHDVQADNGEFKSPPLQVGSQWSSTFDTVGEFKYHCGPHPFMTAVIIVVD